MLTGIAVGAGIMLTYLALIGFAGRHMHGAKAGRDRTAENSARNGTDRP